MSQFIIVSTSFRPCAKLHFIRLLNVFDWWSFTRMNTNQGLTCQVKDIFFPPLKLNIVSSLNTNCWPSIIFILHSGLFRSFFISPGPEPWELYFLGSLAYGFTNEIYSYNILKAEETEAIFFFLWHWEEVCVIQEWLFVAISTF